MIKADKRPILEEKFRIFLENWKSLYLSPVQMILLFENKIKKSFDRKTLILFDSFIRIKNFFRITLNLKFWLKYGSVVFFLFFCSNLRYENVELFLKVDGCWWNTYRSFYEPLQKYWMRWDIAFCAKKTDANLVIGRQRVS